MFAPQMICSLSFSAEGAAVVSCSIDGTVHAWDVRKALVQKESGFREAGKTTTVLDTRHGHVVTTECLMSTMTTKGSRIVSSQFTARNVLLVASEFV